MCFAFDWHHQHVRRIRMCAHCAETNNDTALIGRMGSIRSWIYFRLFHFFVFGYSSLPSPSSSNSDTFLFFWFSTDWFFGFSYKSKIIGRSVRWRLRFISLFFTMNIISIGFVVTFEWAHCPCNCLTHHKINERNIILSFSVEEFFSYLCLLSSLTKPDSSKLETFSFIRKCFN